MDWSQVTLWDLAEALREVDWRSPRPFGEFVLQPSAFTPPKPEKLGARLKTNVYYYRSNYAALFILSFVLCFMRNPVALLAFVCVAQGLLCLNDPFATALNDQLLRIIKQLHTRTALRLRALTANQNDGNLGMKRRVRQRLYILWFRRNLVVVTLCAIGALLVWRSTALRTLAWGFLFGLGLPLLHATFRSPNLKARITTSREEFRAVWRGYQAGLQTDYTQ